MQRVSALPLTHMQTVISSCTRILLCLTTTCLAWQGLPADASGGRRVGGPVRRQAHPGLRRRLVVAGDDGHAAGGVHGAAGAARGARLHGHRRGRRHARHEQPALQVRPSARAIASPMSASLCCSAMRALRAGYRWLSASVPACCGEFPESGVLHAQDQLLSHTRDSCRFFLILQLLRLSGPSLRLITLSPE